MKLLSAHIKNFGTLSNKDYKFGNGINPFIENNGAGKSTLAAFIKAMLFGLESVRENDKDFKERKHYAPFNNQSFGGTLDFEHNGKTYHIERTFDIKSATKDDLKIYVDKELKTGEFETEIGEELLGLDKESFERLLYISSDDIQMASNGNIRKNLNNIIDDSAEGVDYDAIIENLEEVTKKYGNRKGSDTSTLKEKKTSLEQTIINQESISSALTQKYEVRNQKNVELQDLNKKQQANAEINALKECWNTYNGMLDGIKVKKEQIDSLLKSYPKGYPTDEELNNLQEKLNQKTALLGKAKGITFSEDDEKKLNKLKEMFKDGIPSNKEIDNIEQHVKEYNQLMAITSVNQNELSDEEKDIVNKYEKKNYKEDLKTAKTLISDYKNIENVLTGTPKYEEQPVKPNDKKPIPSLIILIISLVIIIAGVVLFFFVIPAAIACVVVGALGLIAAGFLYLKSRIDSSNNPEAKINGEFEKQSRNRIEKEKEIHALLTPYGIYTDSVYGDVQKFENNCQRYEEIIKKQNDSLKDKKEKANQIEQLQKQIRVFLDKFISYQTFDNGLAEIKECIKEHNRLSNAFSIYSADKANNSSEIDVTNKKIKEIDDKYELGLLDQKTTYDAINSDIVLIKQLKKDIDTAELNAETYKQDKQLAGEEPSFDEVKDYTNAIALLNGDLARLDGEIEEDESTVDNIEDNRQALKELKNRIKENERFHGVLTKTEELLKTAQKNLDDKYVAPIMDKFNYYSSLLGDILGFKIVMGREFNIMLEVDGELKSDEHLSSGQRSICALCFRLALLDNIYNEKLPFIIMDDPFMMLDDDNMKATTAMLKTLARNKQIIYFSCTKSREIK